MSQKILSISVAAYNLGEMIDDNLKSFCDKRFINDIEVLVINDGSTDDTAERAQKYAKKYPKSIKVITQKNAGPGATVNNGIKNATGKYFRMVDGDDWVNCDDMAALVECLKDIDVDAVFTNYTPYHQGKREYKKTVCVNNMPVNQKFDFADFVYNYNPPIRMHNTIFRTDIMKKHVKLDDGFYTDSEYMFYPTPYIKTAIYYDLNIYQYRVGLPGQSTSPEKLRTNLSRHRHILDRLLKFYDKEIEKLPPNVANYLSLQIAGYVINHLDNQLLAHNPTMVKDVKALYHEIESEHPILYETLRKDKKSRLVLGSKYLLVRPLSIYLCERYKHI